ncbi:MAG: hypothetical protein LBI03_05755, partial [Clostridiales bacterium]|nr:hypothetical protein [Clostridiales bacterium]
MHTVMFKKDRHGSFYDCYSIIGGGQEGIIHISPDVCHDFVSLPSVSRYGKNVMGYWVYGITPFPVK